MVNRRTHSPVPSPQRAQGSQRSQHREEPRTQQRPQPQQGLNREEEVAPIGRPTPEDLVSCMPMVRALANKVAYGTPSTVYADDLMGEGYVGLLEAARTYDARFGVPFKAYAHGRVYGKMVDYLRALDPMSRRERKATTLVREAREHLQHSLGRAATDEELSEWLGQPMDYVQEATVREHRRRLLMLDEPVADGGDRVRDFVASDEDSQLDRMEAEEIEAAVRKAVSSLPAALRGVIEERDFNGKAVQDIAQAEGVTSSAISQRRRTALKLLRPRLTRIRRG